MKKTGIIIGVILIVALVLFKNATYIVYEDQVAVVKHLGKITTIIVDQGDYEIINSNLGDQDRLESVKVKTSKGLGFKIPFIQTVVKYSSKNITYKSAEEVINTKDDKKIEIGMYAQYRIVDPLQFGLVVETIDNMRRIMDNRVYPVVIQSANRLAFNEFFLKETLEEIVHSKRVELNEELLRDYGIYVTDIGINRKSFPQSNIPAIEQKMSMQIEKERESLIAEGDKAYEEEKAKTDRLQKEILAEALEISATIKAAADAEALKIYQESLKKDFEFYRFIERMNTYKEIKDTTIFLDIESALFEFINGY